MSKVKIIFFMVTVVVLTKGKIIITNLIKSQPWYAIQDISLSLVYTALLICALIIFKPIPIRYSISFLLISNCLEYIARLIPVGRNTEMVINVLALFLLLFAFVYALKFMAMKIDNSELISVYSYWRTMCLIIVAVILMVIIFMWYGQPSIR